MMRRILGWALVVVLVIAASAFIVNIDDSVNRPTSVATTAPMTEWEQEQTESVNPLSDAARRAGINLQVHPFLSADGKTLTLETRGEWETVNPVKYVIIDDVASVLINLNAPVSVGERIDNTRAIDGMQTASWGDITATWTYHPDDGLWLMLEQG